MGGGKVSTPDSEALVRVALWVEARRLLGAERRGHGPAPRGRAQDTQRACLPARSPPPPPTPAGHRGRGPAGDVHAQDAAGHGGRGAAHRGRVQVGAGAAGKGWLPGRWPACCWSHGGWVAAHRGRVQVGLTCCTLRARPGGLARGAGGPRTLQPPSLLPPPSLLLVPPPSATRPVPAVPLASPAQRHPLPRVQQAGAPLLLLTSPTPSHSLRHSPLLRSGTLSYVFNELAPGRAFSEVVWGARRRGYTEPDPREDLSGASPRACRCGDKGRPGGCFRNAAAQSRARARTCRVGAPVHPACAVAGEAQQLGLAAQAHGAGPARGPVGGVHRARRALRLSCVAGARAWAHQAARQAWRARPQARHAPTEVPLSSAPALDAGTAVARRAADPPPCTPAAARPPAPTAHNAHAGMDVTRKVINLARECGAKVELSAVATGAPPAARALLPTGLCTTACRCLGWSAVRRPVLLMSRIQTFSSPHPSRPPRPRRPHCREPGAGAAGGLALAPGVYGQPARGARRGVELFLCSAHACSATGMPARQALLPRPRPHCSSACVTPQHPEHKRNQQPPCPATRCLAPV